MSPFISLRFLQSQTDAKLLSLAAEGHERAFEAPVRRHRRALLAYGRRLLGSSSRAEDAVQQARASGVPSRAWEMRNPRCRTPAERCRS
jgi:DNA-directed RNA polymerase specialized sigma24 family protein